MTVLADFELPPALEASEPPEARGVPRDAVRMMVSRRRTGEITHHPFTDLPGLLLPGDLLVVNTSATLPAAVPCGPGLVMHFSTSLPDGSWLAELRSVRGHATQPYPGGSPGQALPLPGGAVATLAKRVTGRLWRVRLSTAVVPYLLRHGSFIHYSYVASDWPAEAYQTVFAATPGSAEMPSASRPFTAEMLARLVVRGVAIAPLTLHTGVSSLEGDEEPYPEPYDIPPATARLVDATRRAGGRVVAVGTTVVRALETAAAAREQGTADRRPAGVPGVAPRASTAGPVTKEPGRRPAGDPGVVPRASTAGSLPASAGWTHHLVTPQTPPRVVDALFTGLHEPRSTHLLMLHAFAGADLLRRCYAAAVEHSYLWHEFGDVHLLLP
jgi:S-adenosylmethionine:tRNA ribosyltransferase-isomerase